mgnify:CR=1 FL=1
MSKSSRSRKHIEFIDFLVENIRDKEPIEGVFLGGGHHGGRPNLFWKWARD